MPHNDKHDELLKSLATQTDKGASLKNTPKEEKGSSSAAFHALIEDSKKERVLPEPCGKSEIGKINIAIHNFMTTIKGIKKYGELYVMGTINRLQNITSLIRETATIIGAVMKTLMNRLRDYLIDKIHRGIQDLIDKLLPQIAKAIKNTIVQVVVDNIFCKFKDIVKNLVNLAIDFLKELVEKIINVPFCAAQQFTNALVNNIAALVDNSVGPILDQINDILGGVGKIVGNVFQALDFILGLESFLCAAPNCPEITKFKASPWAGPSQQQIDSFNNFLAPLGGSQTPTGGSILADATKFIDGIEIFGSKLGDSAGAASQDLESACSELSQASRCGPPKVEIFGGGGIGAIGELVVDNIGKTIGVNLLNRGSGYKNAPFVSFVDTCETSFLSGYATINNRGEVDDIIIRNPVIVPSNDGRTEFDPSPYCSVNSDCPDNQICINGICTDSNGTCSIDSDCPDGYACINGYCVNVNDIGNGLGMSCSVDTDCPDGYICLEGVCVNANSIGDGDGSGVDGRYGRDYVVCLYGFEVLDTGIGYTVNDSITITPDVPGLIASVQMTEYGQIIAVNLKETICGIPGYPEVEIDSNTGYGAVLRPILSFIRIEEYNERGNGLIDVNMDSTIQAELSSGNREGLITTLRGRKLLTDGELNRRDVIRIVDCIR